MMVDLVLLQSVSYIAGAFGVCVAAIFYVLNLRISQRNMKQTLETLINEEALLFANYLRGENKAWIPRITVN